MSIISIIVIIVTVTYILATGFLFLAFFKGGMTIAGAKKWIKKTIGSCCIKDEEKLEAIIPRKRIEKIKKSYEEIDDCRTPIEEVPLDLCLSSELDEEEVALRERILEIISQRNNFIEDGGKKKLVLPMESIIFLTRGYNPIVNEDGEILISIRHEDLALPSKDDHQEILKKISIYLQDAGVEKCIYEDPEDLINMIIEMYQKEAAIAKGKTPEKEKDSAKEDSALQNDEPTSDKQEETQKEADSSDESIGVSDIFGKSLEGPKEENPEPSKDSPEKNTSVSEETDNETEASKKDEDEESVTLDDLMSATGESDEKDSVSLDDLIDEDEMREGSDEDAVSLDDLIDEEDLGIPDSSENETTPSLDTDSLLDSMEFEEETEDETPIDKLFSSVSPATFASPVPLEGEDLIESLATTLKDHDSAREVILNNLLLTSPIVFSDNKEAALIDSNMFLAAIAIGYGVDKQKALKALAHLSTSKKIKVQKLLCEIFEPYAIDVPAKFKKIAIFKNGEELFSFGLMMETKAFKAVLSSDDFDFFKSASLYSEYSLGSTPSSEAHPLLSSPKDALRG